MPSNPSTPPEQLKQQAVSGVRWTGFSSLLTSLLQLLQILILARLLSPEEFGLMAMILVVLRIGNPLVEAGLTQAVIFKQHLQTTELSTLYWTNLLLGFLTWFAVYGSAEYIASFFRTPDLIPLLRWASLAFLIGPLGQQFHALITKQLSFKIVSKIQIASYLTEFITSITLAISGYGVYALIGGYLGRVTMHTLCNLWIGKRIYTPVLIFDFRATWPLIRYGLFEAGNQLANLVSTQIDKLLIGRLLGASALGLYTIAWELVAFPIARISPVITKVAFPVYARLQNDRSQLNRYYQQAVSTLLLINVPALLGLALVAEEFLALFYGEEWIAAAPALTLLCLMGIAKSFGNPGGGVLLAQGRSDIGFYWNVFWSLTLGLLLWLVLGLYPTLQAAAGTQLIASYSIAWVWHALIARFGHIRYRPLLFELVRTLALSIPMVLCLLALDQFSWSYHWQLFLKIPLGALVYFLSLWFFHRVEFRRLLALLSP